MSVITCGDQCQHRCLATQDPHLPHHWWYTSSGGGHQLDSYDPVSDRMERDVKRHNCPGIEGELDTSGMDPLTAELERQAYDAEWTRIRNLSQPAFGSPVRAGTYVTCDSHVSGAGNPVTHEKSKTCRNWKVVKQIPPGKYNAQISSKPGEPLEFTVDLPDNHTDEDMFEAMHEAARKAGLIP